MCAAPLLRAAQEQLVENQQAETTVVIDCPPGEIEATGVVGAPGQPEVDSRCVEDPEDIELPKENRQEINAEITENTQDAVSLRRLLLGKSYTWFGRIEADYASFGSGALDGEDGFEIRRLRAGVVGVGLFNDKWSYKAELDLTDGDNNLSDFYLKRDLGRLDGSLTIGNQRVSQNLSAMTGALSLLFMERPLPVTTFSLGRRLGVSADTVRDRWGGHVMTFLQDPNNDSGDWGFGMRGFWNPVRSSGGVWHVGGSMVYESLEETARYRTRPESAVTDIRLVDTGPFDNVDYQRTLGLEFAGAVGRISGRIEAFQSTWERDNAKDTTFYGAYWELGYFLTGEHFAYRGGKFVRPDIVGRHGAWELGFRASWVDLNDRDVRGGEQLNIGGAVNYYPRQNVRIQVNLIHVDTDEIAGDEDSWIAQARVQYNF
jgi:phosphate-selective porin OprO/OprP